MKWLSFGWALLTAPYKIARIAIRNRVKRSVTAGSRSPEVIELKKHVPVVYFGTFRYAAIYGRVDHAAREDMLNHLGPYTRAWILNEFGETERRLAMEPELVAYARRVLSTDRPSETLKADAEADQRWMMGRFFDHERNAVFSWLRGPMADVQDSLDC